MRRCWLHMSAHLATGLRKTGSRIRDRLENHSPFFFVFVPLAILYIATASYGFGYHIDPFTNAVAGWHIGMTGSVVMPDYEEAIEPEQFGNIGWFVESPRGPVPQYPPGAALLAAPLYRLANQPLKSALVSGHNNPDAEEISLNIPSFVPATIAAALATAAAMGFFASTIPFVGGTVINGVAVGYVGGIATTMWTVGSDALWQHGPAAMWIALAVFLAARANLIWSGLAFGAAILTRPHVAVVAFGVGVFAVITRRSFTPAIKVGLGASLGLGTLLWYNWWVWEKLTISGGYGDVFVNRAVSGRWIAYLENISGALFDTSHGLLTYSPFLILLVPGLREAWKHAPDWAKGAAVGGVFYLLIQLKANRFSGGEGFVGYRYPLETLAASGTILFLSYRHWVREKRLVRLALWMAISLAVILQVVA